MGTHCNALILVVPKTMRKKLELANAKETKRVSGFFFTVFTVMKKSLKIF
jgi:hypothetical protein